MIENFGYKKRVNLFHPFFYYFNDLFYFFMLATSLLYWSACATAILQAISYFALSLSNSSRETVFDEKAGACVAELFFCEHSDFPNLKGWQDIVFVEKLTRIWLSFLNF